VLEPQPFKASEASLRKISPRLANHLARPANHLAELANDLAGLANDLAGLANDLAGLANDLARLANDLAGLSNDLAGLSNDLAELSKGVARPANDSINGVFDEKSQKLPFLATGHSKYIAEIRGYSTSPTARFVLLK
jgi:ABC-type transporter Mla subunit MlaD